MSRPLFGLLILKSLLVIFVGLSSLLFLEEYVVEGELEGEGEGELEGEGEGD